MTVGPKVHLSADCKLRRVLCPVDLAEDPEPVLHDALALAEENQSEFIVLDVIPLVPCQYRESEDRCSRQAVESLIPEQAKGWCKRQTVASWEYPSECPRIPVHFPRSA